MLPLSSFFLLSKSHYTNEHGPDLPLGLPGSEISKPCKDMMFSCVVLGLLLLFLMEVFLRLGRTPPTEKIHVLGRKRVKVQSDLFGFFSCLWLKQMVSPKSPSFMNKREVDTDSTSNTLLKY